MKTLLAFALIVVLSLVVVGGSLTAFIQPDERAPYFGVRGSSECMLNGIDLSLGWEAGNWFILAAGPGPDLSFYVFEVRPQLQLDTFGGWKIGAAVFCQYRTNHPGHYVIQPEFYITHNW